MNAPSPMLTYAEGARVLGVSEDFLRRRALAGLVPAHRYGHRTVRLALHDLEAYATSHRTGGAQ